MNKQLPKNTELSHYRILSRIGAGAMGEVYLAEDTKLDRKAALKILPEEFAVDVERMRRFVLEAKSASALNHPNIITIYEISEAQRGPSAGQSINFIATEYIEGTTLNNLGRLSVRVALDVTTQIASALQAAHHAGIIHRDIKPENVIIRPDGLVKVLDFGIAKQSDPAVAAGRLGSTDPAGAIAVKGGTSTGMIIGTASYMSPEQARGKIVDARTDIFSLGVVLYEVLAGRKPFTGENPMDVIGSIIADDPPPLRQFLPSLPPEIERIVDKALRKNREDRYQTTSELLADLKSIQKRLEFDAELDLTGSADKEPEKQTQAIRGDEKILDRIEGSMGQDQQGESTSKALEAQTVMLNQTTADAQETPKTTPGTASRKLDHKPVRVTKLLLFALLILFVLMAGVFTYRYLKASTRQIESIAVMPFVNAGGNADVEYLSDGMTEVLISSLSQLPNLKVKARSTVFRYKGKTTDAKTIGKELNVQAILNGRVVQRGDQLTLSLELVDVATENVIWSQQYNRKQTDLVTLQSEVARDVSSKLKSRLSGADVAKVEKNYTTNPEAYQLYLKGRFLWNKRTIASLKQAAEFYRQATEKDPNYALAYAGLAETYVLFSIWNVAMPKESMPQAKAAALRALELDDSLAEPHVALGEYLIYYEWDRSGGEKEFRRAIELNPNYATAHQWLGSEALAPIKRFDEAIAALRRAQELDPLSPIIGTRLGDTLLFAHRYDEAIAQYERTLSLDPDFPYAYQQLGWAYGVKGMYREAVAEERHSLELNPDPTGKGYLALWLAKSGERGEAMKLLDQLKQESSQHYVQSYAFALVYIGLDEKGEAFTWLEKEVSDHAFNANYYSVNPELDGLRTEPRFKEMLKRLNLPE